MALPWHHVQRRGPTHGVTPGQKDHRLFGSRWNQVSDPQGPWCLQRGMNVRVGARRCRARCALSTHLGLGGVGGTEGVHRAERTFAREPDTVGFAEHVLKESRH